MIKKVSSFYKSTVLLLCLAMVLSAGTDKNKNNKNSRSKTVVTNGLIDANNISASLTNVGSIFRLGGNSGYVVPHPVFNTNPIQAATIYASGLWLGGNVSGENRVAAAIYDYDYAPGPLGIDETDGSPVFETDNPADVLYTRYSNTFRQFLTNLSEAEDNTAGSVQKNWAIERLANESTDAEWAVAVSQGAPATPPGDQAIFSVFHDADLDVRANADNGTVRMRVEVRQLVWAFRTSGPLNNSVFVKWDFVNRSGETIEDMYASVWSDPDVGDFVFELVGSDRSLGLGYAYNGEPTDATYTANLGLAPPAVGYDYFQGVMVDSVGSTVIARTNPENGYIAYSNKEAGYVLVANEAEIADKYVRPASSFIYYNNNDNDDGNPQNSDEIYNYMQVKTRSGGVFASQATALADGDTDEENKNFFFSGDPVANTGWLDSQPDDRRFLQNNGPFTMAPYVDTDGSGTANVGDAGFQSVVVGIFTSFGSSNLNSVAVLKGDDFAIQRTFDRAFAVPEPSVSTYGAIVNGPLFCKKRLSSG
jgi:hypothetical protein